VIFSSWTFAIFFVVVFGVYWAVPGRRARHVLLLFASYFFYMSWNPWLVTLIIGSTVLDYCIGLRLHQTARADRRRLLLVCSIVGNLGVLAVFKYADFFVLSLREMMQTLGVQANLSTLSIILPVGISFYTFQSMSYTIDIYRRRIEPTRSFIEFALFVAFFPQLVAGPIVKARDLLPQLKTDRRFSWGRLESGTVLFMVGLTKKLLIADQLAGVVDPVFAQPERYVTGDLWLAMFCYGGQIYCDFSGYTDMAIAAARVLGFDLKPNFLNPYLATSLSDFWRRWHVSLSTWLRDYLYIPLGGSRCGRLLTWRNLTITMLLGGLWHGASWTFVIWGAIHAVALIVGKVFEVPRARPAGRLATYVRVVPAWALTLLVVHVAWVFFRCQPVHPVGAAEPESTVVALERAIYFVTHLVVAPVVERPAWLMNKWPAVWLLCLIAAMQVYDEWVRRGRPRLVLPAPVAGMGYAAWIIVLVVFGADYVNPFIYFQF
jgi:alginate O-acetyltransferase complex protein AlgI